jgi:hypothetical protein
LAPLLAQLGGRVGKSARFKRALAKSAKYRLTASFEYVGPAKVEQAEILGLMDCRDL